MRPHVRRHTVPQIPFPGLVLKCVTPGGLTSARILSRSCFVNGSFAAHSTRSRGRLVGRTARDTQLQQLPFAGATASDPPGSTNTGTASPIRSCVEACCVIEICPVSPSVLFQVISQCVVAVTG